MAITIKDIARELGVSPATVSLALNNSPMIGALTTRRVKETAFRMGYVRNQYSRTSARSRSGTIALVVPDVENLYYASMVKYVSMEAKAAGYDVYIAMTQESIRDEWRILRRMAQQRTEAILLSPVNVGSPSQDYLAWLKECPTPLVFLGARHPGVNAPCVMCDLATGMEELTSHVISAGAQKIALITGESSVETLQLRLNGYRRALEKAGRTGEIWRLNPMEYSEAYDRVMGAQELPDAIICINDATATGVLNAVTARGLKVPDDIMVAGFDDSQFCRISLVPLTSVRQDISAMAATAMSSALTLINGDSRTPGASLPCTLVTRDSTRKKR
jgi:LacI family transcriptional regulator